MRLLIPPPLLSLFYYLPVDICWKDLLNKKKVETLFNVSLTSVCVWHCYFRRSRCNVEKQFTEQVNKLVNIVPGETQLSPRKKKCRYLLQATERAAEASITIAPSHVE